MTSRPELSRLSLNTATIKGASLTDAIEVTVRAGIPAMALWRDRVAELGTHQAAQRIADAGLRVSSLCRGGFLTAIGDDARQAALDDNRRAIEEAHTLGTQSLVLVVGGLIPAGPDIRRGTQSPVDHRTGRDVDLVSARSRVAERIAELVPFAHQAGVRLVIEALHPMYCADRAVVSTMKQALDIAAAFDPEDVGVLVDAFHQWWDPDLGEQVARAGREGRLAGYQVCDYVIPLASDPLLSRGYMGDGFVDFHTLGSYIKGAGYQGDIEVEIFNAHIWASDPDQVVATLAQRYVDLVLPSVQVTP